MQKKTLQNAVCKNTLLRFVRFFCISIYISLIGWMWVICSYGYFGFFLHLGESYRHHVILKSFVWQKTLTVCFMLSKWPIFIKTARPLLTSLWKHRLAKFSKNLMNLWRFAIKIIRAQAIMILIKNKPQVFYWEKYLF